MSRRRTALAALLGCMVAAALGVACDRTVDLTERPDSTLASEGLPDDGFVPDSALFDGPDAFDGQLPGDGGDPPGDSGFPDGEPTADGGITDGP